MNFAHPLAWLLLILLIPIVLLYRLRVHVPSQTVGTGLFWEKALAEETFRSRWRRWRTKFSLALQMLIVALVALAATGPQIPASQRFVLIIDNSATMRATDVRPTRLDEAKRVARQLIDSLRPCDEMAVVAISPAANVGQPYTSDHALLVAAVEAIRATDEPLKQPPPLKVPDDNPLAERRPGQGPIRAIWISDACTRQALVNAQQSGVEVLRVGTASGNLAITRFTARRNKAEPAKCEVFVEVHNQGGQSAQGKLAIAAKPLPAAPLPREESRAAGREGAVTTSFTVPQDARWQHTLTLNLPAAAHLEATIEPHDAYPFDDMATLDVPAPPEASAWRDEIVSAQGQPAISGMGGNRSVASMLAQVPIAGADIRVPVDIGSDPSTLVLPKPGFPLWIIPAALAATIVLMEWCLYQRGWTN